MTLTLEVHHAFEPLERYRDAWNDLVAHNATNEVFLTWQWQTTWWEAYGNGELFIVIGKDDDRLIGVAPWFIEKETRYLRGVGCVDVTDYLDIVVLPEQREPFLQAVADKLLEHKDQFTKLDLCNIPHDSPTLKILPALLESRGFSVQQYQQEVCPVITLPTDFEAYLGQLDKKQRHESRRKLRRIEEASNDEITMRIVTAADDLSAELEMFLRLMASSHPDKAKFLEDPAHQTFFRAVMPQLAACGWLQLVFLMVEGEAAAAYLNFDYDNRVLVYNSGLVPETYAWLSPGIVLTLKNIEYAIGQGRKEFDFLRGNEEYKYRMGGIDRPVMSIEAEPPAL